MCRNYLYIISILTLVSLVSDAQPGNPESNLKITLSQYMAMDTAAQTAFLRAATKNYAREIKAHYPDKANCIATLADTDKAALNHIMTVLETNSTMYPGYPVMNIVQRTSDNLCE